MPGFLIRLIYVVHLVQTLFGNKGGGEVNQKLILKKTFFLFLMKASLKMLRT